MAEIPPRRPGGSHGADMHEPEHARAMGTALRYLAAAGMATQRAQRAFLAHRKAKQAGLILRASEPAAIQNCANELSTEACASAPKRAGELATTVTPMPIAIGRTSDSPRVRSPGLLATAAATPLNRHQRRRLEALDKQSRRRVA
jgi:hypothetical protein